MHRAVVADELGPIENYSLRYVDARPLGPHDARIQVKAAGISFVDVLVAAGRYQVKPPVPFTPGSECAGIVTAIGKEVRTVRIGQKVMASGWHGMFAEVVTLPITALWEMPETLSFAEGATLGVSYATARHALVDRARLKRGETLLVLGAGGATGYAAVQIGSYLGARVIASASSESKRAMAIRGGAVVAVDTRSPQWGKDVSAACSGQGIDVVFDPVGGTQIERAFRTLAFGGRYLIVGFPAGIAALRTNLLLLKSASIVGVNLAQFAKVDPKGARNNHAAILELARRSHIRPVLAKTYPLEQFAQAMQVASRGESAGRIVLTMD